MTTFALPRRRNFLLRWIGRTVLRIMGWRIEGELPSVPKAVLIAAPHTSNWDFVIGVAAKFDLELLVSWLGKHTLFRKPFGFFFRWLGGIPVERDTSHGVVHESIRRVQQHDQFLLALSPEGTRKKVKRWKTGFYQIAKGADIPIIPVAFDYSRKVIQIGALLHPSNSIEEDFLILERFYSTSQGKHSENFNYEISNGIGTP
jgi:1-acyl-sn-glycerol-3-phosphate acyltransferase